MVDYTKYYRKCRFWVAGLIFRKLAPAAGYSKLYWQGAIDYHKIAGMMSTKNVWVIAQSFTESDGFGEVD